MDKYSFHRFVFRTDVLNIASKWKTKSPGRTIATIMERPWEKTCYILGESPMKIFSICLFTVRTSIESVDRRKTVLKISQNKNQSRPPVTCLRYGTIVLLSVLLAFFVLWSIMSGLCLEHCRTHDLRIETPHFDFQTRAKERREHASVTCKLSSAPVLLRLAEAVLNIAECFWMKNFTLTSKLSRLVSKRDVITQQLCEFLQDSVIS